MFAALNSFLTRAVSGYFLNKSLRFRASASAYLNRTFGTPTNNKKWTWSGWVKRGALGANETIFSSYQNGSNYFDFRFNASDQLFVQNRVGAVNLLGTNTTAVYRDPSAWYHIMFVFDSDNATAANRNLLYVNGVSVAWLANSGSSDASNFNASGYEHDISGSQTAGLWALFDGEQAEINFVDGQALAPTSFGASSTYNQWLPIKYAGTYGTNGFYLPFSATSATSYAGSFNGSNQYLNVNSVTAVGTGDFTVEAFVYFNALGDAAFFQLDTAGLVTNWSLSLDAATNTFRFLVRNDIAATNADIYSSTVAVVKQWYHVAGVVSGTTATLYVNGISVASATLSGVRTGTGTTIFMGQNGASGGRFLNGYMSNNRYVKGTAVYTANFTPPTANLTNITNTVLLTLQNATIVDNSSNGYTVVNNNTVVTSVQSPFLNSTVLTADSSGNANNWTPNNISLAAGSTYDSLTDVPTLTSTTVANYAVLNPLQKHDAGYTVALTNGNLSVAITYVSGVNMLTVPSTVKTPASGKWYWEITAKSTLNGGATGVGVITPDSYIESTVPPTDNYLYVQNGNKFTNGTGTAYGSSYTNGDVIGVALDVGAGTITFYKNNTSQGTAFTGLAATTYYAVVTLNDTGSYAANFGQQPFAYTPPTGFLPLNTYNI